MLIDSGKQRRELIIRNGKLNRPDDGIGHHFTFRQPFHRHNALVLFKLNRHLLYQEAQCGKPDNQAQSQHSGGFGIDIGHGCPPID
nr:hypothetical protein [Vibrio cholerae]